MERRNTADQGQSPSARDRLLAATLEVLLERGYRGATSRAIAHAAEVNEVTLFRQFTTKDELLAAAVIRWAERDHDLAPRPTGELDADLETLAETVSRDRGGLLLLRLWGEIGRLPAEQRTAVCRAVDESQAAYGALFRHYQDLGELRAEIGGDGWAIFAGPILTAFLRSELLQEPLRFDAKRHVQLFLQGCAARRDL